MDKLLRPDLKRCIALTVTELLVVILVLSLLLLLISPVYQRALNSSRAVTCAGRVRQTGLGILLYAGDHQQTLPGPFGAANFFPYYREIPRVEGDGLYSYIWPYLTLPKPDDGVLLARTGVCSLAEGRRDDAWLLRSKFFKSSVHLANSPYTPYPEWSALPIGNGMSPAYPFGFTQNGTLIPPSLPWKLTAVPKLAELAILGELPGNLNNSTSYHSSIEGVPDLTQHCNILYLDGRVETRKKHTSTE